MRGHWNHARGGGHLSHPMEEISFNKTTDQSIGVGRPEIISSPFLRPLFQLFLVLSPFLCLSLSHFAPPLILLFRLYPHIPCSFLHTYPRWEKVNFLYICLSVTGLLDAFGLTEFLHDEDDSWHHEPVPEPGSVYEQQAPEHHVQHMREVKHLNNNIKKK